jgi:hypothetical protein
MRFPELFIERMSYMEGIEREAVRSGVDMYNDKETSYKALKDELKNILDFYDFKAKTGKEADIYSCLMMCNRETVKQFIVNIRELSKTYSSKEDFLNDIKRIVDCCGRGDE